MEQVLLLNSNEEIISIISLIKAIKLLCKKKAFIISILDEEKILINGKLNSYPSIIKMNYYISIPEKSSFSKKIIFVRDKWKCAYCLKQFDSNQLTIDHIFPKSLGGKSSFENCIASCLFCNKAKSNLLPLNPKIGIAPSFRIPFLPDIKKWHQDWIYYVLFSLR